MAEYTYWLWLRKRVHNVVVAVDFHVVVLCFYEVVLFYSNKHGALKVFSSSDFGQIINALVVCVVGGRPW